MRSLGLRELWRLWGLTATVAALSMLFVPTGDQRTGGGPVPRPAVRPEIPALPDTASLAPDWAELENTVLWGPRPPAATAAPSQAQPQTVGTGWSLRGVFMVDERRVVVLTFDDAKQPSQPLAVGDSLPNGERILAVERERVLIGADPEQAQWRTINRTRDATP